MDTQPSRMKPHTLHHENAGLEPTHPCFYGRASTMVNITHTGITTTTGAQESRESREKRQHALTQGTNDRRRKGTAKRSITVEEVSRKPLDNNLGCDEQERAIHEPGEGARQRGIGDQADDTDGNNSTLPHGNDVRKRSNKQPNRQPRPSAIRKNRPTTHTDCIQSQEQSKSKQHGGPHGSQGFGVVSGGVLKDLAATRSH